ncbi:hypothetical protein BpHYR1_011471 [Brachionus plicatilis]|uniref:Uncharacterized protein n=1 Tax=Brachionus plicatilis TaxID=10195 RepID=A0A3M7QEC8_BRAPC|nr:hypothetical protein BpHYR1_011471 [Brachionus plicatilis]
MSRWKEKILGNQKRGISASFDHNGNTVNFDPGLDSMEIHMSSLNISMAKLANQPNENSSFDTFDYSFVSSFSKSSNDSSFHLFDASSSSKSQTSTETTSTNQHG